MLKIPADAGDFTVNWLNSALSGSDCLAHSKVVRCTAHASSEPGQTAEVFFLDVEFDSANPDLPRSIVAKLTSQNPQVIEEIIANYDQYRRETSFYRDFPDAGIAVPDCLYQSYDPEAQEFVILMRDLAPAESPSWAVSEDQIVLALSKLPAFHSKWWNQDLLREKDYLVQFDDTDFFTLAFSGAQLISENLPNLFSDCEATMELMAVAKEKLPKMLSFLAGRPYTLVHGDYHSKQMFFPTTKGGDFSVIDWQFPFVAQGAWDFARLLNVCGTTPFRQAREKFLLADYLAGLRAHGIEHYSMDDLEQDYRMGLVISHMINTIAVGTTDISLIVNECKTLGIDWQDLMFYRTQRSLIDWQVRQVLDDL
ncbi:MAG: DUF1679 domain-containing protein [Pseudomonadales bacterium]|nr:DUF1679 domain-containing protein [Pseudomonadales bacterium]